MVDNLLTFCLRKGIFVLLGFEILRNFRMRILSKLLKGSELIADSLIQNDNLITWLNEL